MDKEVIALLPPEEHSEGRAGQRALVRFANGTMAVEELCEETLRSAAPPARFRRSNPIIDPATREVIGYEMERILLRVGAGAGA